MSATSRDGKPDMRHQIESDDLRAPEMATAIEKCVHCGFCLPACPTYSLLGEEMDSPRGRIYLMKNVLEENLSAADAQPYIDRCLGCMACVPACPSGVEYGDSAGELSRAARTRTPAPAAGCPGAKTGDRDAAISQALPAGRSNRADRKSAPRRLAGGLRFHAELAAGDAAAADAHAAPVAGPGRATREGGAAAWLRAAGAGAGDQLRRRPCPGRERRRGA